MKLKTLKTYHLVVTEGKDRKKNFFILAKTFIVITM